MLDPDAVLNSVLASLQSIPELVTELGSPDYITGHFFMAGEENSLVRALAQMRSPSSLVAYLDYIGGNFDGVSRNRWRIHLDRWNLGGDFGGKAVGKPFVGHQGRPEVGYTSERFDVVRLNCGFTR